MKKQKATPELPEHELEAQAVAQLKATHYKEAIRLFKKLLQTANKAEWQQQLAYCYVQRAIQFAAKGMYKEALVLWENHQQYSQPPYDGIDQYIIWLIQANKQADIQQNIAQLSAQQLDKQYPELATVLGVLMLTEHPEFAQNLPQDSMFIAHFNTALIALQALQDNDSEKLDESLKLLPYRSAFRDFRSLLNATAVMPDSVEQAQSFLARIRLHSPYFQSARLLFVCTKEGAALAEELIQLSQQQCSVISKIKGLHKQQLDFIQHFRRQHDNLTDKAQFKLAIQYRALLETEFARYFCQAALTSYPAGKKDFSRHFGALNKFEESRVKALKCEQEDNIYDAEYHWRACLKHLAGDNAEDNLKGALILRRLASREPMGEARTNLLIESLDYEAGDRESYLQITQYFSQQAETAKEYKTWLTKTLNQFPQDVEVLAQAVTAATRNKTYKKACQYANKILKIDPLNTFAKQTLFSSHVAHAQRLMREKSYHLVDKEINQAEKLNMSKAHHKQLCLMRTLLCFANEDKQQGLQSIVEALKALHSNPVSAQFQAVMEALLNGLPVTTILRELAPAKDYLLSAQELTRFIERLEQYAIAEEESEALHKALDKIKAPLKKSISRQDYSEALLLSLCKVLDSLRHFELLRHCAKAAHMKWLAAIWSYYRVYASNNGVGANCSPNDVRLLQFAHERSIEEQDRQTSLLIEALLDSYYAATDPQQEAGFFGDLFAGFMGEDEDDDNNYGHGDPLEELFGHLKQGVMIRLNEQAEVIMKKLTPDKLIHSLLRRAANKEAVITAMISKPDILSALMLLKAAKELKIDIEVDIDDVIDVFDINDSRKPFPF